MQPCWYHVSYTGACIDDAARLLSQRDTNPAGFCFTYVCWSVHPTSSDRTRHRASMIKLMQRVNPAVYRRQRSDPRRVYSNSGRRMSGVARTRHMIVRTASHDVVCTAYRRDRRDGMFALHVRALLRPRLPRLKHVRCFASLSSSIYIHHIDIAV